MKVGVVADASRPYELAHARSQVTRLRRIGFSVVGLFDKLTSHQRDSVEVLFVVGMGAWRRARRLARRSAVLVLYDHPPGAELPGNLRGAEVVIAAGCSDANALSRRFEDSDRLVVVPPDSRQRPAGMRPRLRLRLGIEGQTIAVQEATDLSPGRAEALIQAVAPLHGVDLVLLGGDRWKHRAELAKVAGEVEATARVHFAGEVPVARRFDYLGEADIGVALADGVCRQGRLPAMDVFDTLGIPFVAATDRLDAALENCITSSDDPAALRIAITEACKRQRMPVRDDGTQILKTLLLDLAAASGGSSRPVPSSATRPLWRSKESAAGIARDESAANALLNRANVLRKQGDNEQAVKLYGRIASESKIMPAVAAAAAGFARLNAREDAQVTIDRVMCTAQRSPLATARVGEAAAVLGDLVMARACADEVLAELDASDSALRVAIRVLEQIGEPRVALGVARDVGDETSIARIEGTLKSYDPSWLPLAGGKKTKQTPRAGHAFTLLETSLPHVRSGYTYRAQTFLRAQRCAGIEPTALTRLGFPATRGLDSPPVEDVDGVKHYRVSLPGVEHYTSVPVSEQLEENVRWATALGCEIQPEGVIATTPHLNGLVGLALRSELGIPMIYDVRGFPEMTWAVRNGGEETDVFALRRIAETRCMREADLVTTLSETMRRHIVNRGISPERVFVLPHAVDTDTFAPAGRDQELAASLGLTGRTIIGYVSSLVAYEGVETLLDAIALARQENPSIAGLIVGSGDLLRSLETRATRLGLDGHVVFTGRIDASEITRYYSLTDIFVCPRQDHQVTRYVTPLKPFEAMAAGCCVAVSDLPTLREVVCDGECGALFPAGDEEGLAATILELADNPERRHELKIAARDHTAANHDFDSLCAKFEQVWGELRLRSP